jgi:hypothetical protein
MLRRLIEGNYFANRENPSKEQIRFWFLELRTPDLLIELAKTKGRIPDYLRRKRRVLDLVARGNRSLLESALVEEEQEEREADREYWMPLKKELENFATSGHLHPNQKNRLPHVSWRQSRIVRNNGSASNSS